MWVPMLGAKEKHVAPATQLISDARNQHFWDGPGYFLGAYRKVLGIQERAWDIYMIYGPDARWDGDLPPKPDFWMHQLGPESHPRVTQAPFLDADVFGEQVTKTLGGE